MTFKLAKFLVSNGVSIIPLAGKRPKTEWKRFQTEMMTDSELQYWFSTVYSDIGIVTGKLSGLIVVDADDADGVSLVKDYCPFSPMTRDTSRGSHFYYRAPAEPVPNVQKISGANIDIRGDGGYVCVKRNLTTFTRDLPIYDPTWLGDF